MQLIGAGGASASFRPAYRLPDTGTVRIGDPVCASTQQPTGRGPAGACGKLENRSSQALVSSSTRASAGFPSCKPMEGSCCGRHHT